MSTGYGVVTVIAVTLAIFTILFLSMLMLKAFGKWLTELRGDYAAYKCKRRDRKVVKSSPAVVVGSMENGFHNTEELAAITMALHIYLNANRDEESEIITIEMPAARYSPWAQKNLAMKRVVRR